LTQTIKPVAFPELAIYHTQHNPILVERHMQKVLTTGCSLQFIFGDNISVLFRWYDFKIMCSKVKPDGIVYSRRLMVLAFGLINMVCQFICLNTWWYLIRDKDRCFPRDTTPRNGQGEMCSGPTYIVLYVLT